MPWPLLLSPWEGELVHVNASCSLQVTCAWSSWMLQGLGTANVTLCVRVVLRRQAVSTCLILPTPMNITGPFKSLASIHLEQLGVLEERENSGAAPCAHSQCACMVYTCGHSQRAYMVHTCAHSQRAYMVQVPGQGEMRHGTEGWRCLETSMRALVFILDGAGELQDSQICRKLPP